MDVEVRGPGSMAVHGSVDFYSALTLRRLAMQELLLPTTDELEIDMADVEYMSFEGVGALVDVEEQATRHERSLRVVGLQGQPAELVHVCGLDAALTGTAASNAAAR